MRRAQHIKHVLQWPSIGQAGVMENVPKGIFVNNV